PAAAEGLVVAGRVDGEGAQELAVLGDDSDVGAGHEEAHLAVLVLDAHRDVAESAQVAEGQLAEAVDLVAAHAVVDWGRALGGMGLEPAVEDGGRDLAVEG